MADAGKLLIIDDPAAPKPVSLAEYNAQMQELAERFSDEFVTAIGDAFQSHEEAMRKAIEGAVRWHYCDVACNDGPGGYQGCGIADLALAALEACVTDDLPRLKSEAAQWASLWYRDAAPDTWEEAQAILAAKEGQGEC